MWRVSEILNSSSAFSLRRNCKRLMKVSLIFTFSKGKSRTVLRENISSILATLALIRCDYKISCCCCKLTLAGGQVNGFSPKHKLNTVVMKRSSTGKETMRLPLKSKVDSCKYEISERKKQKKTHLIYMWLMSTTLLPKPSMLLLVLRKVKICIPSPQGYQGYPHQ